MKVLLLADAGSGHTEKWAIGLASKGIEVGIFSFNRAKTNWFDDHENIHLLFQPKEAITGKKLTEKLRYFTYLKKVKAVITSFKPDVLHAHYASSYGLMGALSGHQCFVVSVWGTDVYSFPKERAIKKWILKYVLNKSRVICSTSADMAKETALYTTKKARVIPFGIDVNRFQRQHEKKNGPFVFGTVKALEEVYGIDRLISSFSDYNKLCDQDSELWIYGSGSQGNNLKSLTENLGICSKVKFKGFVSGAELTVAYESMDVFMALSRSESFGVAILEASSMELPVITSNVGGLKEVVSDGNTGFLVDGDNQDQIIERMKALAGNEGLRKKMGVNGRAWVLENYDFQVNLTQQVAVYQELIEKR
jgi:glycosyltransferase involved in cell wall biosynthesis